MTVYIDVLISINFFVDFLLILLTGKITRLHISFKIVVMSSVVGSICSLYILLPSIKALSLLFQILSASIIIFTAYGFGNKVSFIKAVICFFLMSFCMSGILYLIWDLLKIPGLILNNGIFYFDISPLVLIVSTAVGYAVIELIFWVIGKFNNKNEYCDVTIIKNSKSCTLVAKIDTGNTLIEPFSCLPVIITDISAISNILTPEEIDAYIENDIIKICQNDNNRVIPFNTISGKGMISAFKADYVRIENTNKDAYIGVCTGGELGNEYKALLNPELL